MLPHWITLPIFSIIVLLATATTVFADANENTYECSTYRTTKNTSKECGSMFFDTAKNSERSKFLFSNCDNIMIRFTNHGEAPTKLLDTQLIQLTKEDLQAVKKKENIEPKVLSTFTVPQGMLPQRFALTHKDETRTLTTVCHKFR